MFIRKAAAATTQSLAHACLSLLAANNPVEVIGVRAGEKMHETLATGEELLRAEDQVDYWRIPCEQEQSFERFFTDGDSEVARVKPFTSATTRQLDTAEVAALLRTLPGIGAMLAGTGTGETSY